MIKINRINLDASTAEEITLFESNMTRYMTELGIDPSKAFVKLNANVSAGKTAEEREALVSGMLQHFCAEGYHNNGTTYVPFACPASDSRKATTLWIDAVVYTDIGRWAMCGLKTPDLHVAVNKYMAYIGLLLSASKPFKTVFGRKIDIRRVAVIPDLMMDNIARSWDEKVDFVHGNDVDEDVDRDIPINVFDGFAIVNSTMTHGKSATLRGPWLKIFAQAVRWDKLAKFGGHQFVDFWGNTRKLEDVDMILTESCFKMIKFYSSWDEYCDHFEQLHHEISVCVQEHSPKLKGLPYQQGQTLQGDASDIVKFTAFAKATVDKYASIENAPKLLSGWQRKLARLYPAYMNERHAARSIQEKYAARRKDMIGGRIPEIGYNAFLAPDIIAFVQHLFKMPVTGALKGGQCYCSNCTPGPVDITRNPHLDHAHVVLEAVDYLPLAMGPTMFINIMDLTTIRLRADYDGDHVWYSQNGLLLGLVKKTDELIGSRAVDWDAPSAPKSKINKKVIADFVCNLLHGSEIGLYADALTKLWGTTTAKGFSRYETDWLTYAGNVLIDAAKHGSAKIEKPEAVKNVDKLPLPLFAAHAKADMERPFEYFLQPRKDGVIRAQFSGSFLDCYSKSVEENISETITINGTENLIFDPYTLMIRPHRKMIPGLCVMGKRNEDGVYEDAGAFQKIAFRRAEEWKKLSQQSGFTGHKADWEAERREEAMAELLAYVKGVYTPEQLNGVSDASIMDAVYDNIVSYVFCHLKRSSDELDTVLKNTFWMIFGEKAYLTALENLSRDALEDGLAELEELDDEFEDVDESMLDD